MSRSPNKEGGRNSGPRGPCEGRGDRATRSVREPELQLLGAASRSAKTLGGVVGCCSMTRDVIQLRENTLRVSRFSLRNSKRTSR